ncbi:MULTISPECIES: terminase small subunit [Bacteroides]|uniref:terminase small subunit n=1 Tax=Bacteroides TaxID=816 RepID=UPI002A821161|nr:terminase small subunit [Bacteroides nordii]
MSSRLTGNNFWKLRTKHGRDKIFSDAAVLLEEAYMYFDWCDRHPWEKVELVKYKGDYNEADIPLGRPYTVEGLTYYLGVSGSYFRSAKNNLKEKIEQGRATSDEVDLLEAIEMIEQAIRTQQIEGAAVGVFSANLVARINGLVDRQDITSNGMPSIRVNVRDKETEEDIDELNELL